MASLRLQIVGSKFRDRHGREVTIHGINCAADAKFPSEPNLPSHVPDQFFDGDNVSFVGRPFSLADASVHLARLRRWGYNTIRYIFTWEALEAAGPGRYDEDWIRHTISVLRVAKELGFYIFMDPHQDVWSRFCGGSGAPMWTIYACGLNPEAFMTTEAALVHNLYRDPAHFPSMIWSTNYHRLACATIFTLFFGGKDFAPKAVINGQNIQDYLQSHFIAACTYLAQKIHEAGDLEGDVVIGWETINEPSRGLIGHQDLAVLPAEQKLRIGTSPSPWQAILTGSGRACEIDTWEFGPVGPRKTGSNFVDPAGVSVWLQSGAHDAHYGWARDPSWKLGECIWAQHGLWDPVDDALLKSDYFSRDPQTGEVIDYEYFNNHWYMDHYRRFVSAIRSVSPNSMIFCQPPILEIPPSLAGTEDDESNIVFAPHYYDGLTLMLKKWNSYFNVDVFGLLRHKYSSSIFAVRIGEAAIRQCLRDQLRAIREEGVEKLGNHPCVFTEIGIPFDMDSKNAYKTGDYSSQVSAMDANHHALEGSGAAGFTLWTYAALNNHERGDLWNGEDLSIFSEDDVPLPQGTSSPLNESTLSLDRNSPSFSESQSQQLMKDSPTQSVEGLSSQTSSRLAYTKPKADGSRKPGFRAGEAYVRPTPIATHGELLEFAFDLKNCVFSLSLNAETSAAQEAPTEIFLPEYHFPHDRCTVEVSGGQWTINTDGKAGVPFQTLLWWHAEGLQKVTVKGVRRKQGVAVSDGAEEGYLEYCRQQGCKIM